MDHDYPRDSDGDALRLVAESGADMSRPMRIEFQVDAASHEQAVAIGEVGSGRGYDAAVHEDDGTWYVVLTVTMLATYEGVVARQQEITALVSPWDTHCDSWGTFGNTQDGV